MCSSGTVARALSRAVWREGGRGEAAQREGRQVRGMRRSSSLEEGGTRGRREATCRQPGVS